MVLDNCLMNETMKERKAKTRPPSHPCRDAPQTRNNLNTNTNCQDFVLAIRIDFILDLAPVAMSYMVIKTRYAKDLRDYEKLMPKLTLEM